MLHFRFSMPLHFMMLYVARVVHLRAAAHGVHAAPSSEKKTAGLCFPPSVGTGDRPLSRPLLLKQPAQREGSRPAFSACRHKRHCFRRSRRLQ